jgi:hypothetical protein
MMDNKRHKNKVAIEDQQIMPSSIYACGNCNYELFNNLEIVIHDKKESKRV